MEKETARPSLSDKYSHLLCKDFFFCGEHEVIGFEPDCVGCCAVFWEVMMAVVLTVITLIRIMSRAS